MTQQLQVYNGILSPFAFIRIEEGKKTAQADVTLVARDADTHIERMVIKRGLPGVILDIEDGGVVVDFGLPDVTFLYMPVGSLGEFALYSVNGTRVCPDQDVEDRREAPGPVECGSPTFILRGQPYEIAWGEVHSTLTGYSAWWFPYLEIDVRDLGGKTTVDEERAKGRRIRR
jgi:hypothetical protein